MRQEDIIFRNEEEYNAWVLQMLEESEREAADPNVRRITWEESVRAGDAFLHELERRRAAKSA